MYSWKCNNNKHLCLSHIWNCMCDKYYMIIIAEHKRKTRTVRLIKCSSSRWLVWQSSQGGFSFQSIFFVNVLIDEQLQVRRIMNLSALGYIYPVMIGKRSSVLQLDNWISFLNCNTEEKCIVNIINSEIQKSNLLFNQLDFLATSYMMC